MFEKRSTNYCWVFILPLVNLDKWAFGSDNFVNCYVSEDDRYAVVESKTPFNYNITRSSQFRFEFIKNGLHVGVFEFPEAFRKDVEKFREGKFSHFSNEAKIVIKKKYASLYKQPTGQGKYNSNLNLLALDKDEEL